MKMTRGKASIFFYIIVSLAILGILIKLLTNPLAIFKSLLIIVVIAVVLLAIFYFAFKKNNKGSTNSETKKYKQAAKQSKLKYRNYNQGPNESNKKKKENSHHKRKTRKRPPHLKVINGKKPKNNDRANF